MGPFKPSSIRFGFLPPPLLVCLHLGHVTSSPVSLGVDAPAVTSSTPLQALQ